MKRICWMCLTVPSHPIPKFYIFNGMGLRLGNSISLVSSLSGGVEYDRPSLNPFLFFGENFCFLYICMIALYCSEHICGQAA